MEFKPGNLVEIFKVNQQAKNADAGAAQAAAEARVQRSTLNSLIASCFNRPLIFQLQYNGSFRFEGMRIYSPLINPQLNSSMVSWQTGIDRVDPWDFIDRFYDEAPELRYGVPRKRMPKSFLARIIGWGEEEETHEAYIDVLIDDFPFRVRLLLRYIEPIRLPEDEAVSVS